MDLSQVPIIFYTLSFILIYFSQLAQVSSLQCKGEQNQNVDWYVLYKIPKLSESDNPLIKEGVAYLYMDSKSYVSGWTLSKNDITSKTSIPAYTLAPLYDDKKAQDLLWLLYNDQAPNQPVRFNNGHTKGGVVVNDNEGFWLVHSVPNFPSEPNSGQKVIRRTSKNDTESPNNAVDLDLPKGEYIYPSSGKQNGQSFLCISTNKANFDIIGRQLMYNQIIVYRRNIPENLSGKFSVLTAAANEVRIKTAPFNSKLNFYSTSGMEFTSFAKSSKWQKDLYDDFVAPQLSIDLYTETWTNGRGKLPSECNQTRVMNIQSVSLSAAKTHFKSTHDHSKWAVSVDSKNKAAWVCVGDINRAETQFERGGGTVCLNIPEVWKNYKDSVLDVEPCPKKKPKGIFERIRSWFG